MGRIASGEIKFDGRLSIGRIFGGSSDEVKIEIEDNTSSTRVLDLRMNFENFAKAMLGQSSMPAEGSLYSGPTGYKLEVKTENVTSLASLYTKDQDRKSTAKDYLKEYEVDGWRASYDDLFNHHRMHGGTTSVGFYRWVHPETKEVWT
jgi:hypothetical protein